MSDSDRQRDGKSTKTAGQLVDLIEQLSSETIEKYLDRLASAEEVPSKVVVCGCGALRLSPASADSSTKITIAGG